MQSTESTLVRAFTKRRTHVVPAPILTQEAVQRRQAALRQMGLLPALSLSQQEAQLDSFIPPSAPLVLPDSDADRIKNDWVAKNTLPSPPLTPHDHPDTTPPGSNVSLHHSPDRQPPPTISPSPSFVGEPAPYPDQPLPQRKKSVFARFKPRANSSTPTPKHQHPPTRSKSLFTTVKNTVLGSTPLILPPLPPSPTTSTHSPDVVQVKRSSALLLANISESSSELDHDPETTTSKRIGKGLGIGLSLILNRERTISSSPPASPLSSTFLSPPASPTSTSITSASGRGRKRTIGSGSEGLLSVWGGVAGLLAPAPSVVTSASEGISMDGERQAVAPTIHNQASILHHMSNIEDEETRRVTELAFM